MPVRLTRRARRDLDAVLDYSLAHFGPDGAERYRLLLMAALRAVGDDPGRLGSRAVRGRPGVRAYPIAFSRDEVPREQRVGRPAHRLVYQAAAGGVVSVLAVIGLSFPAERAG